MDSTGDLIKRHNVNDNDSKRLRNNVIVNEAQATLIAEKLTNKLQNPDAYKFYCKVAWNLPESKIWYYLDIALTGRNPKKYFSWLCKQNMA